MSNRDDGLIKISELAGLSGVPAPTIKHYINKGLIRGPSLRTSRNMAWYDPGLAPRIRAIRELQRTQFLPLDVIKDMLDGQRLPYGEKDILESVTRAVSGRMSQRRLSRSALLRTGAVESELDWLVEHDFATPETADGEEHWTGDDLALVEAIGSARRAGLTNKMIPVQVLEKYRALMRQVVSFEVELFQANIVPQSDDRLMQLADMAMEHSERLLTILRRKQLVPVLEIALGSQAEVEG